MEAQNYRRALTVYLRRRYKLRFLWSRVRGTALYCISLVRICEVGKTASGASHVVTAWPCPVLAFPVAVQASVGHGSLNRILVKVRQMPPAAFPASLDVRTIGQLSVIFYRWCSVYFSHAFDVNRSIEQSKAASFLRRVLAPVLCGSASVVQYSSGSSRRLSLS